MKLSQVPTSLLLREARRRLAIGPAETHDYTTSFSLMAPVSDLEKAQEYLLSDDMTPFLHEAVPSTKGVVTEIAWDLQYEDGGEVFVRATRELTPGELKEISRWIRAQNSDGLGESFEQQPFAMNEIDEEEIIRQELGSFEDWVANTGWSHDDDFDENEAEEEYQSEVRDLLENYQSDGWARFDWEHNNYPLRKVD